MTLEEMALDEIETEVATLATRIAAATGRMLALLAELDRRAAWAAQGFHSLAHWLAWRTGMGTGAAREHVRVALALRELPTTSAALTDGKLSFSKARAITRTARPETEAMLVEMARYATASQLEHICRGVRRADPAADRALAERIENMRGVELHFDDDGMLVIQARLAPDEGAAFCARWTRREEMSAARNHGR
jgi:hypothetical protein